MANCCLCYLPVSEERRRSKKLYGPGCAHVRADIERLSPQVYQALLTKSSPDARLCCNCEKKFTAVKSLQANLVVAKDAVVALLEGFDIVSGRRQLPTVYTDLALLETPAAAKRHCPNASPNPYSSTVHDIGMFSIFSRHCTFSRP